MAPEQAVGASEQIGPATDLYALGAVLYEMLTGRPPFKAASSYDTLQLVLHADPVRPTELQPRTPHDLETICLKCLQKEPRKRYADARALIEDLRRFRAGEPILARPTSPWERTIKWVRRRPQVAGLLALVALGVAILVAGELYYSHQLKQRTDVAVANEKEANVQRELAEERRGMAEKARALARDNEDLARTQLNKARHLLYMLQLQRVDKLWQSDPAEGLALLKNKTYCPRELREFVWEHYWRLCDRELFTLNEHEDAVTGLALSPDGRLLASASADQSVRLWDAETGKSLKTLPGDGGKITALVFAPDGRTLYWGEAEGAIVVWDLAQAKQHVLRHDNAVIALAITPDGGTLASVSEDRTVLLWDLVTARSREVLCGQRRAVKAVQFERDGKHLILGSLDGTLCIIDCANGQEAAVLNGPKGHQILAVALAADGKLAASAGAEGVVQLWDLKAREPTKTLFQDGLLVQAVAFDPTNRWLATGTSDGVITLWDVTTAQAQLRLRGHERDVHSLGFTANGRRLFSAGWDQTVRCWEVSPDLASATLQGGHEKEVFCLACTPDSKVLAAGGLDKTILLWDLESGKLRQRLQGHSDGVACLAVAQQGRMLVSGSFDKTIKVWDLATGKDRRTLLHHTKDVLALAVAPDGNSIATGSDDKTVRLWDVATGNELLCFPLQADAINALVFTPDGQGLLGAVGDEFKHWDTASGQERASLRGHVGIVLCLGVLSDGHTVFSGSADGKVLQWDLAKPDAPVEVARCTSSVNSLTLSRDGQTLAAGDALGEIKVIDLTTHYERLSLRAHERKAVRALLFDREGRTLITASDDRTVKLWGPLRMTR
jgi:WD40 repeat protein